MSNGEQTYKTLDPPHSRTTHGALYGGTVYYQYRDSQGETYIVDDLSLVPSNAKHVQKVIMQGSTTKPAPEKTVTQSTQVLSQNALASMAQTLGVSPPPVAPAALPAVTATTCLAPAVPPAQNAHFSPGIEAVVGLAVVAGLFMEATRNLASRALVVGVSMALLGSVYMNWANSHGMANVPLPTPASLIKAAETNSQAMQRHVQEQQRMLDAIEHR